MNEIIATMTTNGRITIPVEVRNHLDIQAGEKVVFIIEDNGTVRMRKPKDQPETCAPAQ